MKCTQMTPERLKYRRFTPHNIDLCDWNQVKSILDSLLSRPIESAADLDAHYLDVCDFSSAMNEEFARIQLATSVNTVDEDAQKRYAHFSEAILMHSTPLFKQLDDRFLESPWRDQLDPARYGQLIRLLDNDKKLYRPENVALSIEDSKLGEKHSALIGGFSVEFDGQRLNMTQMSKYLKQTDRALRERAWYAMANTRIQHVAQIDSIFDELISLRDQIARNAGFSNFRDYKHLSYARFDYTPEDCFRFHETIESTAVPLVLKLRELRRQRLGVDSLRPWDLSVDEFGRQPLQPFETEDQLVNGVSEMMDRIYPDLGESLRLLHRHKNLDLMTRRNKAVVGFNMPFDETRVSFIFMNAMGYHFDLTVLLHEAGHAVETQACAHQAISAYRHTPQEWGECASQSMELLGLDHLDVFYPSAEDRKRCILEKYEDILTSLVQTARVDAFQHWIYTHPGHSPSERRNQWMELMNRFKEGTDYSGLEDYTATAWQGIPHLFIVPFYYIEYGITQISALQVMRKVRTDGNSALTKWFDAMKLGYSKTIPELYEAAGLTFRFHGAFAEDLIRFVDQEIDRVERDTQH